MADSEKKIKAYALAQVKKYKDKDRLTQRDMEAIEKFSKISKMKKGDRGFDFAERSIQLMKDNVKGAGGYSKGGMCRGMGAAIKGGKFEGVK